MAARWGVGEESLTTGSMEFFTTYSLDEGHLSGEGSGLTLDAQLDSADGLEHFHSCLDPSILSIFEDSLATGEARGRADEESEATLLTALTEILDNVDDENLSPFDTLPDSELFSGQRGREPSPLRRLLNLARSPPGREPVRSPKSITPIPAKSEKLGAEREQKARTLPWVPDLAIQRSDGEEEEEEGGGGLTPSSEGPCSPDAAEAGGLLSLDQDGRCVALSLSDLVKHMHTYCLEVSLEPGEGDGLLPEGAIVLEVVDQGEQGEPVLAVSSSLGLMEALSANEEAGFQQEAAPQDEEQEQVSQEAGVSSSSSKESCSLPASVSEENDDEKASEERPRVEAFGKYPTGRKKKRKSDDGGGQIAERRVLRSASVNLVKESPEEPMETGLEKKAQTTKKKKKRVTFAPVLTSFLESPVDGECGSESTEAPAPEQPPPVLEDGKSDSAPAAPQAPEINSQPCEAASVQEEAPVSQLAEPEPKPRPLSLQQYRLLRQQKKPAPVVKQEDQSTKWPSLPDPPTELLPIPCLVEPQPQPASKTSPPAEPAWQPVGTEAPPTPQALLVPLASLGSASKAAATPAKPASVPKSTEGSQNGPSPPREPSAVLPQKPIEPGVCKLQEPSRQSPPPGVQYNKATPTQGVAHRLGSQETKPQQPLPSAAAAPQPSTFGVKHQAQHVPPVQAATQTPKLPAIPIPVKKGVPPQQTAAPTPQRAPQKRLTPVQMPLSGKRNLRASQDSTSEIGIEATDLTSLLEQFEETQAKEEQRVPALCGRAAAVGSSSLERQPDKKPLERPRGPDLGSTAGLTPPATPPHQVWKPLTPVTLLGKAKQAEGAKPSPSKAAQVAAPQLPSGSKAGARSPAAAATPLPPKPAALKEPPAFSDHDYCLPTERPVESLKGTYYGGKHQPGTVVKATPRTSIQTVAQPVAAATSSNATPVPAPAKFVSQPLDHRTLTGSVMLSPDSSPCRPEAAGDCAPALGVEQHKSGGGLRFSERPAGPHGRERGRTRRRYRGRSSSSESSSSGSSSRSSSPSQSSSGSTSRSRSRSDSRSPPRKRFCFRRSESSSSGSSRSSSRSPPRHRYSYSTARSWSRSRSRSCSPQDPRHQWWRESCSPSFAHRNRYDSRECFQWQDVKARKEKAIEERRVVYVGRIRGGMTRKELKERFSQYGEIEECTLHFRDYGDNYGFVTYYDTKDAFNAIENGSKLRQSDELPFDLCFGGRRQFCKSTYADLDSNRDYDPVPARSKYDALDFDTLLKQAQKGIKR
ncbi:peroxisome proliferator-activated receptor gamma coactivator-related protein 1 [Anguilla rostrata]|uniref:peroxisome proliferator-activated receptor gamma coactivator-related protein 1 n=1 Tax=Anguilla rostrata TaxID=7938 RepID=UPI0030CF8247